MSAIRVAAAQAAPMFLDREATIEKACALIAEAARGGARLVVFPESFVPGYPDWVWVVPAGRGALLADLHRRLLENAVEVPGPATERLAEVAREHQIVVAIGVTERSGEGSGSTMYNSLLLFDADGRLAGCHRKLVPTGGERLVWGQGDASGLIAHDTAVGRVGGLICWENYMPLARFALYAAGVQIYVAPTWDHGDGWLATLRHIAREGRVYVIGCSIAMRFRDLPDDIGFKDLYPSEREWLNPGESAIVDPKGKVIAGPVAGAEEILFADADLSSAAGARWDLDVAGHYARPDVFDLRIDRAPRKMTR